MRLRFDRGTVLIEDAPAGADLATLPWVVWDSRVSRYRAAGMHFSQLADALSRRAIAYDDLVSPTLPGPGPWERIDLRPYQAAALTSWSVSGRRGLVVLPTGSGKTRLALAAMAECGRRALVLVPTRVMLSHWQTEIGKYYQGEIGLLGDGSRSVRAITVSTFESAYRYMGEFGNRFDLLVIDEAHHFGDGPRSEALELSTAADRLGLTATPLRDPPGAARLESLIGPTVYELALGDLTGRFLAPFDVCTLILSFAPADARTYRTLRGVFAPYFRGFFSRLPEAEWADLCREAGRSDEGRRALSAWRRAHRLAGFHQAKAEVVSALLHRHRDNRLIVFTASNEAAYAIARANLIMPITCDIGREERREALDLFSRGGLRALVSSQVLNEGVDVPDADVAIIAGGSRSEREHVQRVGRLLRPAPGKRALVYELVTRETSEVRQAGRLRGALTRRTAGVGA